MEGSSRGSASIPAPFLVKTYEMVDDPSTNSIVSWSPNNASFVVWKQMEFARDLLPVYFKHNNFSSFVRQLNTYGFKKIDPDQWEFANDDFVRGQKHLLKNIYRRKPVHSHSLSTQPLSEAERQELEEEIERLKQEKRRLWNELQKHTQQQHGMECQMQSLEERLQVLGNRQRSLMAFLGRIIQKPSFLSNLVQHSDLHSKKRRLPKNDYFNEDTYVEDNQIESSQSPAGEYTFDIEPFEKMESSLNSLENFFRDVSRASGDDLPYDSIVLSLNSNVIFTEMNASSGETAANLQSQLSTLHPSSPCPGDIQSSPEIQESTSYAQAPDPATEKQADSGSRFSEIDVNSEPAATEVDSSRDRTAASTVATGANDVFWEQFLTEMPGSSDTKEGQSRNPDDKQNAGKLGNQESTLWNRKYLYHFAEKIENLMSTEKT